MDQQGDLAKTIQAKFDKKLREKEIEILEYWKDQLDRVCSLKPEGIASLQAQIRKVADMMANRAKILKRE